jgi:plasmid stabilization system protein ParE
MEQGSHVIFYVEESGGIYIARILHKNMLPEKHEL